MQVSEIDAETLLHVVSPKLLDHYTIWDLMLQKGKINAAVGTGVMETVLNDINAVLGEMKLLVDSCLKPIRLGKAQIELKKKRRVVLKNKILCLFL